MKNYFGVFDAQSTKAKIGFYILTDNQGIWNIKDCILAPLDRSSIPNNLMDVSLSPVGIADRFESSQVTFSNAKDRGEFWSSIDSVLSSFAVQLETCKRGEFTTKEFTWSQSLTPH